MSLNMPGGDASPQKVPGAVLDQVEQYGVSKIFQVTVAEPTEYELLKRCSFPFQDSIGSNRQLFVLYLSHEEEGLRQFLKAQGVHYHSIETIPLMRLSKDARSKVTRALKYQKGKETVVLAGVVLVPEESFTRPD